MNPELQQTRELATRLKVMIDQFRSTITPGTADQPAVEKAADRGEEAVIEMMRRATDELAAGHAGGHPNSFQCPYCPGEHHLTKDLEFIVHENEGRFQPAVLMRQFQYSLRHAREVVRQLRLRGHCIAEEYGEQLDAVGEFLLGEENVERRTSNAELRTAEVAAR